MLNSIGLVYFSQGNYSQALEHYQKSLALYDELGDKAGRTNALINIGNVYGSQGNYAQALDYYEKSLTLIEELGNKAGLAITLINIGVIYSLQGNYARALGYYHRSFTLKEELGDNDGSARILNNIGSIYALQGNYTQALEYFLKGFKLMDELGDRAMRATAVSNIGNVYNSQGKYVEALEYYQRSLALTEELGDKAQQAITLNNIGEVHGSQGNYAQALEYFQKSLVLREELGNKAGRAITLNNIGEAYNSQGNYVRALEHAQIASTLGNQVGSNSILWRAQLTAGRAHRALAQPDLARKAFSEAIATIESLRTQTAGGEQERQRSFERQVDPYLELSDLLADGGNTAQALETVERARSRVLLDVLQAGRVNIAKAMSPAEQEQERQFNLRLAALNQQATREQSRPQPDPARLDEINRQLDKARLEFEDFRTKLYAAHPELKVRRGEALSLTAQDFGQLLPDGQTALLEFAISEQQVSLFVLTKSSRGAEVEIKCYPLAIKPKELAADAVSFREMLLEKNLEFAQLAVELYQHLLQPAAAQLRGKRALVIVPDGPLWELPFQALKTPAKRYLLQDHVIFYAPSLSALREMSRRKPTQQAAPTLLALGNPALGVPGKGRAAVLMGKNLVPLPDAGQQVRELQRLYGSARSKIYVGAEAREERVKSEANNYSILHLAAHGILNDRAPMYSHLVLAQGGEGSKEDGVLEAREIVELDLKADLAVLSACETARGRVSAGEGMIGLTWALFVAGVPRTVVSQWKVESDSTSELMVEFHRQFKTQGAKGGAAEALRKASLKLLRGNKYNHPFHWAGFIVIGDGF